MRPAASKYHNVRCAPYRQRPVQGAAILIVCAALVLPLLDPHALEGDPYHEHVIVGGSPTDQARALAAHLRHFARPVLQHSVGTGATGCNDHSSHAGARVLSIRGDSGTGSSVIGLGNAVAMEARTAVPIAPSARLAVIYFSANTLDVILPVPDPPPRGS